MLRVQAMKVSADKTGSLETRIAGKSYSFVSLSGSKLIFSDIRGINQELIGAEHAFLFKVVARGDQKRKIKAAMSAYRERALEIDEKWVDERNTLSKISFEEVLRRGARKDNLENLDLTFMPLIDLDFAGISLRGSDLSFSNIAGSTFTFSDIRGVNMRGLSGVESAVFFKTKAAPRQAVVVMKGLMLMGSLAFE